MKTAVYGFALTLAALSVPVVALAVDDSASSFPASQDAVADVPADLLTIYQRSAQRCPGLPWTVLAAIGKIESDHGRSTAPGVHAGSNAAGAAGPLQLGVGGRAGNTWAAYHVDADGSGTADVHDPADAVAAAADYLCDHGGGVHEQLPQAIYAYNHADWYVADVLAQAAAYTDLPTLTPGPVAAQAAIAFAESKIGLPYQWGGTGPLYDCSGLTQAAYAAAGVRLSRTSQEQFWDGPQMTLAQLQPGDLVFYAHDITDPTTIHHDGLYVGSGLMIESPHTGAFVRYAPIDRPGYIGAIRPVVQIGSGTRESAPQSGWRRRSSTAPELRQAVHDGPRPGFHHEKRHLPCSRCRGVDSGTYRVHGAAGR